MSTTVYTRTAIYDIMYRNTVLLNGCRCPNRGFGP